MPGAVAGTSTYALTNVTLPYILKLAARGWRAAALDDPAIRSGINVVDGAVAQRKVAEAITSEGLSRGSTYRNSAGNQFTSTLEDILTHVTLHGSYHRGQVASLIRSAGDTPSPTDYIFFARGAPAATRQS